MKVCRTCLVSKHLGDFTSAPHHGDGVSSSCKPCIAHKSRVRYARKLTENPKCFLERNRKTAKESLQRERTDPRVRLLRAARERAKTLGVPFAISLEDIHVPHICPALGIPLVQGLGKPHAGSPTLDRVIPTLGYVRGNVAVISYKANAMKQDADPEQLRRVATWLDSVSQSQPVKGDDCELLHLPPLGGVGDDVR